MRLTRDQSAPSFSVEDIDGKEQSIHHYQGKKLLLSFYRYAGCPLCNLRVHQLGQEASQLAAQGLHMVGIFQSPAEHIREHIGQDKRPFPIIADPDHHLYALYGVQGSWLGMARAMKRMGDMGRAIKLGILPGKPEGDIHMIPADFLINEQGKILCAYYGKDIGDHLPLSDISQILSRDMLIKT